MMMIVLCSDQHHLIDQIHRVKHIQNFPKGDHQPVQAIFNKNWTEKKKAIWRPIARLMYNTLIQKTSRGFLMTLSTMSLINPSKLSTILNF